MTATELLAALSPQYADIVIENLGRRYPYSAQHTIREASDQRTPAELHPAFATSFDWHSSVHMHWLGVSLIDAGLDADRDAALRALIETNLSAENLVVEADYLIANPSWERPYGWAWLARLAATCRRSEDPQLARWGVLLDPIVDVLAGLVPAWTAKADWPVRHGLHTNSAFGLTLLIDAFRSLGRADAAIACETAAVRFFSADLDWPGQFELSGQDFLSAGLAEADLMSRVLGHDEFAEWLAGFLPSVQRGDRMLQPLTVSDESDGYLVHLHGLNLSRAGQLARIVLALGENDPLAPVLRSAAPALLDAGLSGAASGDFMSTHWLASFAFDTLQSTAELEASA